MHNIEEIKGEGLSGVFRADKIVDYQSGAVVSRTIIDKDAGTVTVFAFDQGQKLSEHTAPYEALVTVIEGEGTISISGEKHLLSVGDSIIMPANKPHAVFAMKRFKMMLTMIKGE